MNVEKKDGARGWCVFIACLVEVISGSSQKTDCAGKVATHTCRSTLLCLRLCR